MVIANPMEFTMVKAVPFNSATAGCNFRYVRSIMGTNAQKAYNSHICPKYPKAADRKRLLLNTLNDALNCILLPGLRNGPSGTKRIIKTPPIKAMEEMSINTIRQGSSSEKPRSRRGKAVPITNAPTKNPSDLPNPS